jgi:hypothetical protein
LLDRAWSDDFDSLEPCWHCVWSHQTHSCSLTASKTKREEYEDIREQYHVVGEGAAATSLLSYV